jgi:hypothetical protein
MRLRPFTDPQVFGHDFSINGCVKHNMSFSEIRFGMDAKINPGTDNPPHKWLELLQPFKEFGCLEIRESIVHNDHIKLGIFDVRVSEIKRL